MSVAEFEIIGNIGKAVTEQLSTKTKGKVHVAVTRSYKIDEEWQTETHWYYIDCWKPSLIEKITSGKLAKGKKVRATGEIRTERWGDNDDNYRTVFVADRIILL